MAARAAPSRSPILRRTATPMVPTVWWPTDRTATGQRAPRGRRGRLAAGLVRPARRRTLSRPPPPTCPTHRTPLRHRAPRP